MTTAAELREKQQSYIAEARDYLEQALNTSDESRSKELEERHDNIMAEADKLEERAAKIEKQEEYEARLNEAKDPAPAQESRTVEAATQQQVDERGAFLNYMKRGYGGLTSEEKSIIEKRAQGTGSGSAGGHTVPTEFEARIVEKMQLAGPMLEPGVTAQMTTNSGATIEIPTADDTSNKGKLISENTQVGETDVTFGQKQLEAYLYSSDLIRVSESLLMDTGVDLEDFLADALGRRLGRIANEHLTIGTGSSQPNGIITASTNGATTSGTSAVTFEELMDLIHSVDPMYRQQENVRFMFNDNTLKALRKIKDGDGNFIWQPSNARTGEPAQLLGYTYSINQDVADLGTGNKFALFGAFNRYMVRRVNGMPLKRLTERYADFGQVGFLSFARLDGELQDTTAVKHIDNA